MKIVINFSTLKAGGGQSVALNFLMHVNNKCPKDIELYYLVAKGSRIHEYLRSKGHSNFYVVPSNPILRILCEISLVRFHLWLVKPDLIYSYFGFGLFGRKYKQVTGSADSNLYFPEVDFWKGESRVRRLKRYLVDSYRLWGLKRCAAVVYENRAMQSRARTLYGIEETVFISPSINFSDFGEECLLPCAVGNESLKILFLCGWQKNKNVMLIPELASELKKNGIEASIYLTAPADGSLYHREFESLVTKYKVRDNVILLGGIQKEKLPSLYQKIDYVFLLSKLESFSNNIIEAWYFEKNLVVADEPWARSVCGEAAIYVDRDSAENIVEVLRKYERNNSLKDEKVCKGVQALKEYPSIEERVAMEIDFLKEVHDSD